jgi:hypothetical protein
MGPSGTMPDVMRDYRVLDPYIQSGALIQLNAGSLLGLYGWSADRRKLLKNGYVNMCERHSPHRQYERTVAQGLREDCKDNGEMKALNYAA